MKAPPAGMPCGICSNTEGNRAFEASEMMFGLADSFPYFECAVCGCLQIAEPPRDLARYYPAAYYSFGKLGPRALPPLQALLARWQARHSLLGSHRIPGLRSKRHGAYEWFRKTGTRFDSRILDVGCGSGRRLLDLAAEGFTRLTGQDLFVPGTLDYGNGVRVLKVELSAMPGAYDLIMLHHSLEHMPDQHGVLRELGRLLAPGGWVLIRTPMAARAWQQYGADWVALDAPRHLFVHTVRSLRLLTDKAGFETADVVFDSGNLQFWASELIRRGEPWLERTPGGYRPRKRAFSRRQLRAFRRRAKQLNRSGEGDTACFYLRRKVAPEAERALDLPAALS